MLITITVVTLALSIWFIGFISGWICKPASQTPRRCGRFGRAIRDPKDTRRLKVYEIQAGNRRIRKEYA